MRAIVRHELAPALKESGVIRPQGAPNSIIGRTEAMHAAFSVMPQDDIGLDTPRIAYSDRGRRFRELEVEPNQRMFKCDRPDCYWDIHTPFGMQFGRPRSPRK